MLGYGNQNPSRPGRTPPLLCMDLRDYNPTDPGPNVLCDPPSRTLRPDGHRHVLTQVNALSKLPEYTTISMDKPYTVASICEECRIHISLTVDPTQGGYNETRPCPSSDNPLHHLYYCPDESRPIYPASRERWEDIRAFRCTGKECPIKVTVTTKPALVTERLKALLMDKPTLRERQNRFIQMHKDKVDETTKTRTDDLPGKALETMVSYLKNACQGNSRSIPRENMRYNNFLTDECAELFQLAGFQSSPDNQWWQPPDPEKFPSVFEMYEEVLIISDKHRRSTRPGNPIRSDLTLARTTMKTILGCKVYDNTRVQSGYRNEQCVTYYAGLGVIDDFSDELIIWAYKRQCETDPTNRPYLFECLEKIAQSRVTEALQVEVATQRSQGAFTLEEVFAAARALGIENVDTAEESLIIGTFQARLLDAPRQELTMRHQLDIIGQYRNSHTILAAAQKTSFRDVKSACDWLNIPQETEDSMIVSTYTSRVADYPNDESTAKEAVRKIAEHRNSSLLLSFLETGLFVDVPPDIGKAFATLGIDDRTIDDDMLITVFTMRYSDAPSQVHELRSALRVIGSERNSRKILDFLTTGENPSGRPGSEESPVGLENIGNTCYLNSLLQFYFTIKPLREMVLRLEEYEEADIDDAVLKRKRVGGRKVSRQEIERAKKFAGHLRTLFKDLISSKMTSVAPQRDLAYLALVSSKDEEAERRKSISVEGPKQQIIDLSGSDEPMAMDIDTPNLPAPDDAGSEVTLTSETPVDPLPSHTAEDLPPPYSADGSDFVMVDADVKIPDRDDKENFPPLGAAKNSETLVTEKPLLRTAASEAEDITLPDADDASRPMTPPMPDRPPPIPPRPDAKKRESFSGDLMFGRQQDVTECIGNFMFQLEAAIRPTDHDAHGEQMDLIKEYFYGTTKQTLTFPDSEEVRKKEELFNHLIVNVAESDKDIYSALDSSFDVEQVDLEGKSAKRYLSIGRLPPILQIQVQRVQYDREKGTAYKAHAHLNFPETIFMDRYLDMDGEPALQARREETWKWKEELKGLLKRKAELTTTTAGVDIPTVLDATKELLEDFEIVDSELAVTSDVTSSLEHRSMEVRRELDVIEEQIKLLESRVAQQFTDLRAHGYRIHSVFIHRGTVTFGHYWIYIYDFQKGVWRKYNDERVDEVVNPQEIFTTAPNDNQPPTPYFLVFIREGHESEITEAVKREIRDMSPLDLNLTPLI